ncbi:MAG TPA: hypothetical protein VEC37_06070 [Bacillota bacterium]|nr:hypothetical protein [Bacillota bacterium]
MECLNRKAIRSNSFWLTALDMIRNLASNRIWPGRAFIMDTIENRESLKGQTILADVTEQICKENLLVVQVEELRRFGDLLNRNELVLCFAAKPINRLEGYFLMKLGCHSPLEKGAVLWVDQAYLQKKGREWQVVIRVKSDGFFTVQMLYSRVPEIRRSWSFEPDNNQEPQVVESLYAFALPDSFLQVLPNGPLKEWKKISLRIDPGLFVEAAKLDRCQQLLEGLTRYLTVGGEPFIWKRSLIRNETLREIVGQIGLESTPKLVIITDQGMKLPVGETDFIPQLRQTIVLKNSDGSFVGAELWLGLNE